jgi:hypothetical protein
LLQACPLRTEKREVYHRTADVQDRDGGALLTATLFGAFPFLTRLFANGGYQGQQFKGAIQRTYPSRRRGLGTGVTAKRDKAAVVKFLKTHDEEIWPAAKRRHRRALLVSGGDEKESGNSIAR